MARASVVLSMLLVVVSLAAAAKLPTSFMKCSNSDPEYTECLRKAVEKAWPALVKGVPSLGVLPIDPLQITEIVMNQGSGSITFNLSLNNAVVHGFKDVNIISANTMMPQGGLDIEAEVQFPQLRIESDYKVLGRIILLPLLGDGKSNISLSDVTVKVSIENEKESRNGDEYIRVKKFGLKVLPKKFSLDLQNLFNGDKMLSENMLLYLNANSQEVFRELSPAIEESFGDVMKEISNRIFTRVPYKTIFLP